jgi:hypothetical protein
MNKQPIESAKDADLRSSAIALQRAALRARELAERTGTALVVSHQGVMEHVWPAQVTVVTRVQETSPTPESQ